MNITSTLFEISSFGGEALVTRLNKMKNADQIFNSMDKVSIVNNKLTDNLESNIEQIIKKINDNDQIVKEIITDDKAKKILKDILENEKKAATIFNKLDLKNKLNLAIAKLDNFENPFKNLLDFMVNKSWKSKFDSLEPNLQELFKKDFFSYDFNKLDNFMQNDDLFEVWKNFRKNHPDTPTCF